MAFPQKLQFVLKHFTSYSVLTVVANAFYAPVIHIFNCRCLQNHLHFRSRSSYHPFRYVFRYCRNSFVLREMYCFSFTSGKTYHVIQTWRMVKWFRYPCHDVGSYLLFYLIDFWPTIRLTHIHKGSNYWLMQELSNGTFRSCLSDCRKNPKISDTRKFIVITLKVEQNGISLE